MAQGLTLTHNLPVGLQTLSIAFIRKVRCIVSDGRTHVRGQVEHVRLPGGDIIYSIYSQLPFGSNSLTN